MNDIIEWDVLNWSVALKIWQPILDKLPRHSKVLAIGERNGGLSLWLALQGFKVVCTDRQGITDKAKEMHSWYGVADKIQYASLDIVNDFVIPDQYDIIIMKSVLGGLKETYNDSHTRTDNTRQKAVTNIYNMLKPDALLLTADNLLGSSLMQSVRARAGKTDNWHYFSINDIKILLANFSSTDIYSFGIIPTRLPVPILNTATFVLNVFLKRLLPQTFNYISISVARK